MAQGRSMRRLLALVGIGALVLLAGFPFVSRWRLEHRLARVFELNARLTARVVPRPVPDGSVDEAFACAYAVLKPLPREVPALHRDWDATGVDPLQPWFDGEVLTPSPEVAEALGELEPAMAVLRTCAAALARAERAFDDVLALAQQPGPDRAEASAAFDLFISSEPDSLVDLEGELQSLETTRLSLSILSAIATNSALPAGLTLTQRTLTGFTPETLAIPRFEPR